MVAYTRSRDRIHPAREVQAADSALNLNIHVYGFSYHTDRQGVRRSRVGNELNLGLGLSYDFGPVTVNAIYVPRYREYNQFAVYGFYFSIPFSR